MRHFIDNSINQINLLVFNFEKLENGNPLYFPPK